MLELRWIQRRDSGWPPHPVQGALNRAFVQHARQSWVELYPLGPGLRQRREASPRELEQAGGQIGPLPIPARLVKLGHNLASIGDEHGFARPNEPEELAEAVLEVPDSDCDHGDHCSRK